MIKQFIFENFFQIAGLLFGGSGTVFGIYMNKKMKTLQENKVEKEVEESTLDLTAKNLKLYQDMVDDLKIRFEKTIEQYAVDIQRLETLLEESRKTIGRQEIFLKEKNLEIDRLSGILIKHKIPFKKDEK